MTVYNY